LVTTNMSGKPIRTSLLRQYSLIYDYASVHHEMGALRFASVAGWCMLTCAGAKLVNRDAAAKFRNDQKDRLAFRSIGSQDRGPFGHG
jgi:hypothetical protein